MRWLVLLAACGAGSSKESCTEAVCPQGGQHYKFCSGNGSCRYLGSDNTTFTCKSCSDCSLAASQVASWCSTATVATDGGIAFTPCDVARQNCVVGQKCVGFFDGQAVVGKCVDDGTVGAGQPCSPEESPDTLLDNCRAGLVCDSLFGGFDRVCRRICARDGDCSAGERCGDFLYAGAGWGWCAPTCTPFSTQGCPSGMDCGETVATVEQPATGEGGFFLCKHTGKLEAYDFCISDSDCGAFLWCGIVDPQDKTARCLPNCSDFMDCPEPPTITGLVASCHPLVGTPDNAGYCLAN